MDDSASTLEEVQKVEPLQSAPFEIMLDEPITIMDKTDVTSDSSNREQLEQEAQTTVDNETLRHSVNRITKPPAEFDKGSESESEASSSEDDPASVIWLKF